MRCFFDTSALVPVFVPSHVHHDRSIAVFSAVDRKSGYSAAHCLAEVYASSTRLPGKDRAAPDQAMLCLEEIQERLNLVALEPGEYVSTIRQAAEMGIVGGALYDALLGVCALKAQADILYTWNTRDFQRLGADVRGRIRTP